MRLISFDVGIKNMAYCIFELDKETNTMRVIRWDIIRLVPDAPPTTLTCTAEGKRSSTVLCGKPAKYVSPDNGHCFCDTHAKKQTEWLLPKKEYTSATMKKTPVDTIYELYARLLHPASEDTRPKKQTLIDALVHYYSSRVLVLVKTIGAEPNAKDVDLISIGRIMYEKLAEIAELDTVTDVIIENQISTIASRMKTIQGMLSQTFVVMRGNAVNVEYVSSANKLRGMMEPEKNAAATTASVKYRMHKTEGVRICRGFLSENADSLGRWIPVFDKSKKKDDLADSFLQGIWYLKTKKIISYADNLKINSVSVS
jgi:hypothetical protein